MHHRFIGSYRLARCLEPDGSIPVSGRTYHISNYIIGNIYKIYFHYLFIFKEVQHRERGYLISTFLGFVSDELQIISVKCSESCRKTK